MNMLVLAWANVVADLTLPEIPNKTVLNKRIYKERENIYYHGNKHWKLFEKRDLYIASQTNQYLKR